MLNSDNTAIGKTAAVSGTIDLVYDRGVDVATAQKIGMQGMRDPALHSVLRSGQRLPQHLPAKYLWAANIAAVPAKDVVFNALELQ